MSRKPAPTDLLLTDLLPHLDATLGQGKGGTAHAPIRLHRGKQIRPRPAWRPTSGAPPVCGIDPGNTGALAVLRDGLDPFLLQMPLVTGDHDRQYPDVRQICALVRLYAVRHVVIEKMQPRPGMGHIGRATLIGGYQKICGAIESMDPPIHLLAVGPTTWQAEMLRDAPPNSALRVKSGNDKPTRGPAASRAWELWPEAAWPVVQCKRRGLQHEMQTCNCSHRGALEDGPPDASLLSEFGRRLLARGEWK